MEFEADIHPLNPTEAELCSDLEGFLKPMEAKHDCLPQNGLFRQKSHFRFSMKIESDFFGSKHPSEAHRDYGWLHLASVGLRKHSGCSGPGRPGGVVMYLRIFKSSTDAAMPIPVVGRLSQRPS